MLCGLVLQDRMVTLAGNNLYLNSGLTVITMARKRRQFLKSTVVTSTVLLTGCLDSSSSERTTERPAAGVEDYIADRQNEDGDTPSKDKPEESTVPNREQREQLLDEYNNGVTENNRAVSQIDRGTGAYNDGNYDSALTRYSSGKETMERAEQYFSDAVETATILNHEQAKEICEDALEMATLYFQSTQYAERSAEAALDGDFDRANELSDKATQLRNEANRVSVQSPQALKRILEL